MIDRWNYKKLPDGPGKIVVMERTQRLKPKRADPTAPKSPSPYSRLKPDQFCRTTIAVLEVREGMRMPNTFSVRSPSVLRVFRVWEDLPHGKTAASPYRRALAAAHKLAAMERELQARRENPESWGC
jgi:hypothetical protein